MQSTVLHCALLHWPALQCTVVRSTAMHHWVATGERRLANNNLQNRKSTIKLVISEIFRRFWRLESFLAWPRAGILSYQCECMPGVPGGWLLVLHTRYSEMPLTLKWMDWSGLDWTSLHWTALHCTAPFCNDLEWIIFYCTLLYCIALHCTKL